MFGKMAVAGGQGKNFSCIELLQQLTRLHKTVSVASTEHSPSEGADFVFWVCLGSYSFYVYVYTPTHVSGIAPDI